MKIPDAVRRSVQTAVHALLGEVSWRPPAWLHRTGQGIARRPALSLLAFAALVAAAAGGWFAWNGWKHRPQPLESDWIVQAPPAPSEDHVFHPQPLWITFDHSVGALQLLDKQNISGMTMTPDMPGSWRWTNGSSLIFTPTKDWPAGTEYRITLAKQLFAPRTRIAAWSKTFHTAPFTAQINDLIFYINPKDPSVKQVTATFHFSHPVSRDSLQHELQLALTDNAPVFPDGQPKFTLTYDYRDQVAYFRSANITLPRVSTFLRLTLPTTLQPASGEPLASEEHKDVRIPTEFDLFHVNSTQVVIVKNKDAEPEQALIVNTSVGVKSNGLNGKIHAYVLPPRFDEDHKPKPWDGPAEIDAKVLAKSKEVDLLPIASEQDTTSTPSFRIKAPENAQVYVMIGRGVTALGGFKLVDDYQAVTNVPAYEREVKLMYNGSLLALNGDRKLSVSSRGVDEIEYRLARVNPGEINHLVSQSEGSFSSPVFESGSFGESDLAEAIVRRVTVADSDTAKHNYSSLDFGEFIDSRGANDGKLGLFILHAFGRKAGDDGGYYKEDGSVLSDDDLSKQNNDREEKARPDEVNGLLNDRRLILVTDLGLIVKDNADKTHDVFVQSIKSGGPVGGAKITVLGKNGLPLVIVETDSQGRAAIPSLEEFDHEKRPVAYVAQVGRDVSFLPFGREDRELNLSRFDTAGLEGIKPGDLTAFVFTDRGIYRPGDDVKLGFLVKQHDWRGNLAGVPLELDITDPRGQQVETRTLKCDATGLLETSLATRETSPTGEYQADLYLARNKDDKTLLGEQSFRVREFLPDRLKITAKLLGDIPEGWVDQKGLKALVTLRNLYGSSAAGNKMKGKLTLTPSGFGFSKFPGYNFVDPHYQSGDRKSYELDLLEQDTNDNGEATFALDATGLQPSAYQLSFLAEGFEKEGGRSVTAYTGVLVSPSAWLLGTKPEGDLNYIDHDSKRSVRLLAVDPHLNPVAADHLTLKLAERRYVSVLVQEPNGNYAYESTLQETPVTETNVPVAAGGTDWPIPTDHPGDFAARFYNEQGDLMADLRYTVAGAGNLTRALQKNAELTAKLSKPEYKSGEEIEVQVTAPYTGSGLITIERDKVYATQWFKATSTSSVQKIRLPADFEGNGYLNISFVRGLDSKEIYMSPLSYAVLPFKVDQEARHTHLDIAAPKVAVPGQPLTWTVTASRPTRAIVYAVDEGILQVAGYQLPDPLAYFFRKEALGVGTRQTVDQILPEYSIAREIAATGGDSGQDLLSHHLNPFKRKHDAPVVYWSGIVELGPQAKSFTYNVPDYFAGTIRLMVVADSSDAVGSEQTTTQVRGPFVILPNVPTFLAPGDTFDLSVTIANNITGSGPNAAVDCDLSTTDNLEIVQKPGGPVLIPEGKDASDHWIVRAKDGLGNADLTVTAHRNDTMSKLTSHLSVRPPVAFLTTLNSGYFTDSTKQLDLTRKLYPQFASNAVTASILPQGFSRGLGTYLEHYEYGCTEQLISKAFPSLVSDQTMQQGLKPAEVQQHLESIYGILASRQNDQGAFGYWQAEPDLHFDIASLWGVQLLTEAHERGYDVPDTMFSRALDHLKQMAQEDPGNSFQNARVQAEAIYLLTRNGTVTTNYLEHTRQWFEEHAKDTWGDDIADPYLGASYAILRNQNQADKLMSRFKLAGAKMQAEDDYYNELGRDSIYIDLLAHHFPERLHKLKPDDLMALAKPIMDGEYTTLSAAQAILALDDYARAVSQGGDTALAGLTIDQLKGQAAEKLQLTSGLYPTGSFDLDASALLFHQPHHSDIGLPGLFYQVTQAGFDHEPATTPISEGLQVSREYRSGDHAVNTVKLGDELDVVLRVRGTGDRYISNVAILDLLPGGFEVVPESISTGSCRYEAFTYADVREDRVAVFGDVMNHETTIRYRIKATNKGTYAVPPPQAEAMYHLKIRARGTSDQLTVTD